MSKQRSVLVTIWKAKTTVSKICRSTPQHKVHFANGNFYNSSLFGITSNQQGTSVSGTMKKGEYAAAHSEGIMVLKWNDMEDVPHIITYHDMELVPDKTWVVDTVKPQPVGDYNVAISGNDLKDKILQPCLLEEKRRILNARIHNSYTIYNSKTKNSIF
jgi:hypothetical protein